MALIVKKNVSVMPIFDAKKIRKERIPSQTFNEVLLSLFKLKVKVSLKEIMHRPPFAGRK